MTSDTELPADVREELDKLAQRYRRAGGVGMQVLNLIGGSAEGLLDRLPDPVRERLDGATETALTVAMRAAHGSRGIVADQPGWLNVAVTTAMGAAGGFGGRSCRLPSLHLGAARARTVYSCKIGMCSFAASARVCRSVV